MPSCSSIDYKIEVRYEKMKPQSEGNEDVRSSLLVYFADDEFVVLRRYASYGTVSMLSDIGGLLGLFLGVSVLSIVEIFYFFVIRLVNNLWWKPNH